MLHHQYHLCILGKEEGEGHRAKGSCQVSLPLFNEFSWKSHPGTLCFHITDQNYGTQLPLAKMKSRKRIFFRAGHIATWNKRGVLLVRENGREDIR